MASITSLVPTYVSLKDFVSICAEIDANVKGSGQHKAKPPEELIGEFLRGESGYPSALPPLPAQESTVLPEQGHTFKINTKPTKRPKPPERPARVPVEKVLDTVSMEGVVVE